MSKTLLRPSILLAVATFMGLGPITVGEPALAASRAGGCPFGTVCDHALGVALVPSPGWRRMPSDKLPPHAIGLFAPPGVELSYGSRLIIASDGTTHERNDARAATAAANTLTRGYRRLRMRPPLIRIPVRYGEAPGIMIRNLPGQPTLVVVIVLAHHGVLYRIVATGATLALDQRRVLNSLRFIPRVGPFPSVNPPAPKASPPHRTMPPVQTISLFSNPQAHQHVRVYSPYFRTPKGWMLSYHVACPGRQGRIVVIIENNIRRIVDRIVHRSGRAFNIRQRENMAGTLRLDVLSSCSHWRVTASGTHLKQIKDSG